MITRRTNKIYLFLSERDFVDGEFNSILASPRGHLTTLSAFVNTLCGIVTPICFAALRLMMNSNLIGCREY